MESVKAAINAAVAAVTPQKKILFVVTSADSNSSTGHYCLSEIVIFSLSRNDSSLTQIARHMRTIPS